MRRFGMALLALAMCISLCACMTIDMGAADNGGAADAVTPTQAATMAPTMPMPTEPAAEEMEPSTAPVGGSTDPVIGNTDLETDNGNQGSGNVSAGCNHNFSEATCRAPATCSLCGETRGEPGEHNFTKSGCSVCGAENPARAKIAKALKAIERYPKYININKDLIETDYNLFDMTSEMEYFNNAHKRTLEIQDYLKTVMQQCQGCEDDDFWIKEIVEDCQACILDMPVVPTSTGRTAILKYISKCKSYATKADRIFAVYDNLCKDYGVE